MPLFKAKLAPIFCLRRQLTVNIVDNSGKELEKYPFKISNVYLLLLQFYFTVLKSIVQKTHVFI